MSDDKLRPTEDLCDERSWWNRRLASGDFDTPADAGRAVSRIKQINRELESRGSGL